MYEDDRIESERERWRHDIHVHLHIDGPVTINVVNSVPQTPRPLPAVSAQLLTGDGFMAGKITVDQSGKVKVGFSDDKGDTDAAPPVGNGSGPVVVSYTSADPTKATVVPDPANQYEGDVTGLAEGTGISIGADILNADGTPVMEPDGVTPFTVAPVLVDVGAGNAVSATLAQE